MEIGYYESAREEADRKMEKLVAVVCAALWLSDNSFSSFRYFRNSSDSLYMRSQTHTDKEYGYNTLDNFNGSVLISIERVNSSVFLYLMVFTLFIVSIRENLVVRQNCPNCCFG